MGEPLPICFLNGEFLPLREARISPLDRGFLYSDGAYEVTPVYGGRPFRFAQHHDRLTRSLQGDPHGGSAGARGLARPVSRAHRAATARRRRSLYICAGDARRRIRPQPRAAARCAAHRVRLRLALAGRPRRAGAKTACPRSPPHDTRWARCDIKSVSLLANVLLRQLAVDDNACETLLIRDGQLTDSSASSVHVVIDGELRTPPNSWKLLPGTTRGVIEEIADRAGVEWRSAPVSEADLRAASEILLGAATREVQPVTTLDGKPVGDGKPGPGVAQALRCVPGVQARTRGDAVVTNISGDGEELLKFPTAYPIKVVGRRSESMRANIDAIVRAHVPDLDDEPDLRARQQSAAFPGDHLHHQRPEQGTGRGARQCAAGEQGRDHADLSQCGTAA